MLIYTVWYNTLAFIHGKMQNRHDSGAFWAVFSLMKPFPKAQGTDAPFPKAQGTDASTGNFAS